MNNISDWLNRADYTADERRNICAQLLSEAQYWDITQYLKMMHDSTKRPWVGLTDEEVIDIAFESADRESAVFQTIDKLKEKNT
jgi:hypothetical protein